MSWQKLALCCVLCAMCCNSWHMSALCMESKLRAQIAAEEVIQVPTLHTGRLCTPRIYTLYTFYFLGERHYYQKHLWLFANMVYICLHIGPAQGLCPHPRPSEMSLYMELL